MNAEAHDSSIEVIEPIRRNLIVLGVRMFLIIFVADSLYALLILITISGAVPAEWTTTYTMFLWLAHSVKNVFLTYALISMVIRWISSLYYVTAGHLIRQRGVLQIEETVFQLTDIESVVLNQSWLGKLFDYGEVTITFLIAQQRDQVRLYAINHPQKYEHLFSKYV